MHCKSGFRDRHAYLKKAFSGSTGYKFMERGFCSFLAVILAIFVPVISTNLFAQTGGEGALQGTVIDESGAAIPDAVVTAINQASKVETTRNASKAGVFMIAPLTPGIYTVKVTAPGFAALTQENIEVNGLNVTGLNPTLHVGSAEQTITVTEAPPQLQTSSAVVGDVLTNHVYESLPVVMNNQQRDPTSFATLAPGAQTGTRAPIFAGTGNYLAEVYLDGLPTTTSNQQGDNRVVSNSIPVESVEQMQIISSGPSAEYQGAGAIGLTIKSGGNKYHGQIVDLIRNTAFDTWGFGGNQLTKSALVNGVVTNVPAGKSPEHQNEISASAGGPVPFFHDKLFFFVNYDRFHGTQGVNPAIYTLPTALMRGGDFTELTSKPVIYNPLTNTCTTSTNCSRQAFQGVKNGVATYNVVPSSYISPISQFEQKYLPSTNISGLVNNYITTGVNGYDNWEFVSKVNWIMNDRHRLSFVLSHGKRDSIGYGATLPLPYTVGYSSSITPTMGIIEHTWTITSSLVNQFNYGFTRFPQPVKNPTQGISGYRATDLGITGLPSGQASDNFPGSTFGTTTAFVNAQSAWGASGATYSSHNTVPNAFTIVDNLQWMKGKHNLTFGVQTQWLQDNVTTQDTHSGIFYQTWSGISTANFVGSTLSSTSTGYAYASFLLGAVNTSATSVPLFNETGGRYHPISPYVQDDWKIRPNLTLNLGLRWDYLPPYHEVQDRWSFFNPSATNSLTGNLGQLMYAGYRGSDMSCQCRTPVHTYWKNWGPRLGLEYAPNEKTVIRAGFAVAYSRAGGVGGRAGDSVGTGQTGFSSSIVLPSASNTGTAAGPSYYLNNSSAFQSAGVANTNFGGASYTIPAATQPSVSQLTVNTGNYINSSGSYVTPGGAAGYADPYLSGRAPEFIFYNLGVQRALTNAMTLTLNYSGSQSHFVAGATVPGFWSGTMNPRYLDTLGSVFVDKGSVNILSAPATTANVATAQAADSSVTAPYAGYVAAAAKSTTPTIGRMLRPYPQYSAPPSATWDNIANLNYNAFQLTLKMREYKGTNFTLNYTYSKNVGDDGTVRSYFPVSATASSSGKAMPGNNRADRSIVATDMTQSLNAYGYAKLPFGKGQIGKNSWLVRAVGSGWQLSGIYNYRSGTPILVVGTGCTAPAQGQCMPDLAPGRTLKSARINGGYGAKGVTYANFSQKSYLDVTAFQKLNTYPLPSDAASNATAITKIGTAPRSSSSLRAPSYYNVDAALQRSFDINQRLKFIFRADCFDVTNKVTFSIAQTQTVSVIDPSASSSSFGKFSSFSGSRKFQFSGRVTF